MDEGIDSEKSSLAEKTQSRQLDRSKSSKSYKSKRSFYNQPSSTFWFSLSSYHLDEENFLQPYPYGSDGAMLYEDLRARLKEIPQPIIDYMGMKSFNYAYYLLEY